MSKLKFILLFFFLISIVSVALAETNQSTTADEGKDVLLRVTVMSLILVAIAFLLSHYMDDHDRYGHQLLKLQYYCCHYGTSEELSRYMRRYKGDKTEKDVFDDCILFCVTLMHFGIISVTLVSCFLVSSFIATSLIIELMPICELSLVKLILIPIIFVLDLILLFQLWLYSRQGNTIARWIEDLKKIEFDKCCCKKYQEKIYIPTHRIGQGLTNMRLWLARNFLTDILFIIWCIILLITFIHFWGCIT